MYGKHHSEETREKIRASLVGRKGPEKSEETRRKLSDSLKGHEVSAETRESIREAAHKKQVLCVETGIVYQSVRDAQRQTGADRSVIIKCCTGRSKTAGGYHWEYFDTPIFDTQNS